MLQAFIDDSGTGGPLFVMAGCVATAEKWEAFTDEWEAVRKSGKAIAHLKMVEAFGLTGEFRGFSEKERDDKIYDLINVVNKYAALSAVCAIDGTAYQKLLAGGPAKTLDTPYFHACMTIMMQFVVGVRRNIGPANPIDFIFDRMHPSLLQEIVQMWWLWKNTMPPGIREMLGNHPRMDDGENLLPLEAAELAAGCLRRALADLHRGVSIPESKAKFIEAFKIPIFSKQITPAELAQLRQVGQTFGPTDREESHERKKRQEKFFNLYPDFRGR